MLQFRVIYTWSFKFCSQFAKLVSEIASTVDLVKLRHCGEFVELPASWLISPSAWFLLLVSVWLQLVGLRCHSGLGEHHHPPPIVLDNPRKVLDTCKFIAFCNSWEYEKLFQFTKKPNWCAIGLALMVVLIRLIFRISLYKESRLKQYIE